ncbi:MAG: AI-2E family transporter [Nocardioidaceae bacterium]
MAERPPSQPRVPAMLAGSAAVCWRLLVVGVTFLALVLVLNRLTIVVVPIFIAIFFTAMLHRPVEWLRGRGLGRMAATWSVLLAALAIVLGVGWLMVTVSSGQTQQIASQFDDVTTELQQFLHHIPGVGSSGGANNVSDRMVGWIQQHRSAVMGGVLTAGRYAGEIATGLIIAFFLTYFFLADGDRIWSWTVRLLSPGTQPSVNGAGHRAFRVLSGWVMGTAAIACIHGVVIGTVLWLLGTPLVIPLAVLVFVGSFIPVVGAFLFGGVAVLVTLVTQGWVAALILLMVLLVENQVEAHLLQPFIVGRAVRLHPVAIVLVLAGAGALAGLIGAIVAVPLVAALHAAVKYATGVEDLHGHPLREEDRMSPLAPPEAAPLPFLADRAGDRASADGGTRLRSARAKGA